MSARIRRTALLLPLLLFPSLAAAEPPANFRRENLVAWCIVPFDAKKRTPHERAAMLSRLGLKRVAYDWREENAGEFESEFLAYKQQGIELFAFWKGDPAAYGIFERLGLKPQIWIPLPTGKGLSNREKIESAAEMLVPAAEETGRRGLALGLYNQGGWGGLPDNLVAVCKVLHARGFRHAGIVYNFHHAHPRIATFGDDLRKMRPHLLCVALNGMADPARADLSKSEHRIKPLGSGEHEASMIGELVAQRYEGPVAIIGHVATRDVEEVLRENLEGLDRILSGLP